MPRNWNSLADNSEGLYTPDNFKQAMYQLVTHQCLYVRTHTHAVSYRLISEYRDAFEEAVALMGLRLGFDDRREFCFVVPESVKDTPVNTEETLFLLTLRQIYHTKASAGDISPEGDVVVRLPELFSTYHSLTKRELKEGSPLRDLVKSASRKGLARIHERDSFDNDPQPFSVTILPGIAEVLSEAAVSHFGASLKASLVTAEAPATENVEKAQEHEDA